MPVGVSSQVEAIQHLVDARVAVSGGEAAQPVRELVAHGVGDELVLGVLEDEADLRGQLTRLRAAGIERRRTIPGDQHLPARGRHDPGDRLRERGLARPVRPDDRGERPPEEPRA